MGRLVFRLRIKLQPPCAYDDVVVDRSVARRRSADAEVADSPVIVDTCDVRRRSRTLTPGYKAAFVGQCRLADEHSSLRVVILIAELQPGALREKRCMCPRLSLLKIQIGRAPTSKVLIAAFFFWKLASTIVPLVVIGRCRFKMIASGVIELASEVGSVGRGDNDAHRESEGGSSGGKQTAHDGHVSLM